jgi:O-antigen ligase
MLLFVGWALSVTLLISVRYDYSDNYYLLFSLLKLGKFVLYGVAGLLTARALVNDRIRQEFVRSLAVAGVFVGIALFFVGQKSTATAETSALGYKASNGVSVMAALIACYLCGLWMRRKAENKWNNWLMMAAMASMVVGSAISEGRGGWVAGIAGFVYLCYRGGFRRKSLLMAAAVPIFILLLYAYSPVFQKRVDLTLFERQSGVGAIDDGDRGKIFVSGVKHFLNSPVLGTGFFHRGGQTDLPLTGSHNFFLQMFSETGIPGGLLMLAIFCLLWRKAGSASAKQAELEVPTKAALVAAFVGGMSGEYFYGGLPLFTLLAVHAACGSLPAMVVSPAAMRVKVKAFRKAYHYSPLSY